MSKLSTYWYGHEEPPPGSIPAKSLGNSTPLSYPLASPSLSSTIHTPSIHPLSFISVFHDSDQLLAMLDTGAEVNVIGQRLANRLKCLCVVSRELKLKGCGGESTTSQWVNIPLSLPNGQTCTVRAAVSAEFGSALILGAPFLHSVAGQIDYGSGLFTTKSGAIPLVSSANLLQSNTSVMSVSIALSEEDRKSLNQKVEKSDLPPEERLQLEGLLLEFGDLWVGNPRGETNVIRHGIKTTTQRPIRQKPRRFTAEQRKIIDDEVDKMLKSKAIRPSQSPHAQEVVLVKKKTGDWRFCIDFRKLNDVTVPDEHPLPRIQDLVRSIRDSHYFVALDLRAGYWQILMDEESIPYTAFRTHRGLFEFIVMPFGLRNAPATFSRLMERVIGPLYWQNVSVYLDDVLIHGKQFGDTLSRLKQVLTRLREANLTLALNKCEFFPSSLLYLGYIIEKGQLKPNMKRVQALRRIKNPTSSRDVRSLLGCLGYFRPFIPQYSRVAEPLNRLLRKNTPFVWSGDQEQAKMKLIEALECATLTNPLETDLLKLETDASDTAIGAALFCRRSADQAWRPVEFLSKNLNETQRRWPVHEREAFAIVHSLEKFDAYLRGRKFEVWTDNASLKWMQTAKVGKVARWVSRLAEYEIEVIYRPGRTNVCADFLSRHVDNAPDECLPDKATIWVTTAPIPTLESIIEVQKKEFPPKGRGYTIRDGVAYHQGKLWVPPSCRVPLIEQFHNLALFYHPGVRRTTTMIRRIFSWSGVLVDVTNYVKGCLECQRLRPGIEALQGIVTPHPVEEPFSRVHLDIYEVTVDGQHHKCLTMIDNHSKWVEVVVLVEKTAEAIADAFLKTWVCRYGCPDTLVTDNDPALIGSVMQQLHQQLGVKALRTTVDHPDSNAPVESFHRVLSKGLQRFALSKSNDLAFDTVIQLIVFGYRIAIHSSIRDTPAYLTFGFDPKPPAAGGLPPLRPKAVDRLQILNTIREEVVHRAHLRHMQQFKHNQEHRLTKPLQVGEIVLLPVNRAEAAYHAVPHRGRKVMPKFTMPYRIVRIFNLGRSAHCRNLVPLSRRANPIREASIQDIRRILVPQSLQQRQQWDNMLESYLLDHSIDESLRSELINEFWTELACPQLEETPTKRVRRE